MSSENKGEKSRVENLDVEQGQEILPEQLTARKTDFSKWYNQVIQLAGLIDKRYNVKGCFVWLEYGYSVMLNIKKHWDELFKKAGIKELYFPLLVPLEYAKQNNDWFEGFKDQAFWVKGGVEGGEQYILRPTGEPAMYPMFKLWIRTHKDLPLRVYETVSSFRYETKHTRPLIRDREITVWHEIHTAHASKLEADEEAKLHEKLYDELWRVIAVKPLKVWKPKWEVFPGAIGAIEYYAIMPDGRALENGSINLLGQAYAKKFGITFKDANGEEKFAWQVCTGNGARLLVAAIATHGDDRGLVLPPRIAPIKVVIVPILFKDAKREVETLALEVSEMLSKAGIENVVDLNDETPGSKFYYWELKGVPLRIEIGPEELNTGELTIFKRNDYKKLRVAKQQVVDVVKKLLVQIQEELLVKASEAFEKSFVEVNSKQELVEAVNNKKVAVVHWCGSGDCWDEIKNLAEGVELFGTDLKPSKGKCVICGKECNSKGYVAKTY
ncbi:proline--tRNA ligase [Candidatus Woesearchaeota archaeon]|nr:proline--tRNA ligase [Candidatus Woesearchaeota archaeon]